MTFQAPGSAPKFGFQQNAEASREAAKSAGVELQGYSLPVFNTPPDKTGNGIPFYLWLLPDYHKLPTRDYTNGTPIFHARVIKRVLGTSMCYYSPSVQFPGTAVPATKNLFEAQLDRMKIRWEKDDRLSAPDKEFRASLRDNVRVLMQAVVIDPATWQPARDEAGQPMVVVVDNAEKYHNSNGWKTLIDQAAQFGVCLFDPARGAIVKGTRRGQGKTDTTYTLEQLLMDGSGPYSLARNADGSPNWAVIDEVLRKVVPWETLLEVPNEATQQKLIDEALEIRQQAMTPVQPNMPTPPAAGGPAAPFAMQPGPAAPGVSYPPGFVPATAPATATAAPPAGPPPFATSGGPPAPAYHPPSGPLHPGFAPAAPTAPAVPPAGPPAYAPGVTHAPPAPAVPAAPVAPHQAPGAATPPPPMPGAVTAPTPPPFAMPMPGGPGPAAPPFGVQPPTTIPSSNPAAPPMPRP